MRSRWASVVLVVLGLWAGVLHATLVTRPNKTCGTTNYSSEVTAGCTTIKSSELDGDINALVGGVNDITTANIDPVGLGTAALANSAVTGSKLATNAVSAANIIAGSTVTAFASVSVPLNRPSNGTTEVVYGTLPGITTRGGQTFIVGTISGKFDTAIMGDTITVELYRTISASTTLRQTWQATGNGSTSTSTAIFIPVIFSEVPGVGSVTYEVRVKTNSATAVFTSNASFAGKLFAFELA